MTISWNIIYGHQYFETHVVIRSIVKEVQMGRMGTRICMAESLHCSSETTTTLLIGYTPRMDTPIMDAQIFQNIFSTVILCFNMKGFFCNPLCLQFKMLFWEGISSFPVCQGAAWHTQSCMLWDVLLWEGRTPQSKMSGSTAEFLCFLGSHRVKVLQ